MVRYFFHLRDGSDELLDPDGVEFDNLAAMQAAVLASARDVIAGDAHNGVIDLGHWIDAETESGEIVHRLALRDAVRLERVSA